MTIPPSATSRPVRWKAATSGILLLAFLLLVRIGITAQLSSALVGKWALRTVAGRPPSTINIKAWEISFSPNGKWKYSGEMTGSFAGMRVEGSGSWTVKNDILSYSAGATHGTCKIAIKARALSFSPDPVLMPDGKTPVNTEYERAGN